MTATVLHILVNSGDDHATLKRRDAIVKEAGVTTNAVQRINLTQDEPGSVIDTVTALDLFGGRRVATVEHFELFPKELLSILGEGLVKSDALVVAVTGKAPTKADLAKLGDRAAVEKFAAPRGRGVADKIAQLARDHGLRLTASQAKRLARANVADFSGLDDLFTQAAIVGTDSIDEERFAGIEAAVMGDPMPWDLSDAIEAGDAAAALRIVETQRGSAFGTFGYLAGRIRDLSLAIEAGSLDPAIIQKATGMRHPYPAKKLAQVARRFDSNRLGSLWDLVAEGDRRLRSEGDERRVLAEVVVAMSSQYAR